MIIVGCTTIVFTRAGRLIQALHHCERTSGTARQLDDLVRAFLPKLGEKGVCIGELDDTLHLLWKKPGVLDDVDDRFGERCCLTGTVSRGSILPKDFKVFCRMLRHRNSLSKTR